MNPVVHGAWGSLIAPARTDKVSKAGKGWGWLQCFEGKNRLIKLGFVSSVKPIFTALLGTPHTA